MNIAHDNNEQKGRFYVLEQGKVLAEMTYTWAGESRFIIDHTDVDVSLKGQGVGKLMLLEAVNFARAKHVKIIPLCPFARSVFDKDDSLSDVL